MKTEFHYRALDKNGKLISGTGSATDEFELNKNLKAEGLTLISAEHAKKMSPKGIWKKLINFSSVSEHDKIIVYRNVSAMLEAGLPLSRALTIIQKQAGNQKLKKVVSEINDEVKKGSNFSSALKKFPKIFSPLMVSMVEAGEESGNLVEALNVTAEQMEKTYVLKKKVKGAMIYPSVIVTAMIGIGIFMLMYVVPTLTATFEELDVELPKSTQFILDLSSFIQNNTTLFFSIILVLVLSFSLTLKTKKGRRAFDWFLLHVPVVSLLVKEINSARTTRTLASLLSSGVPFVRSLEIVRDVVQNSYYKEVIQKAQKNIQVGKPISEVFTKADKYYPIFVGEMMAVGEETGDMGAMLIKVALFYEDEVDQKTKNMSTIIEPFLMIIVGIAVGFFALSMITPMYSLVDTI